MMKNPSAVPWKKISAQKEELIVQKNKITPPKSWTGKILPRLLTILQMELTLFTTHFSHRYSTLPDPTTLQTVLP